MARKVIRVLNGFNRNAVITMQRGVPLTIGSQDDSSVILVDDGVASSHCQFTLTNAGLICTALDAALVIAGQTVSPGRAVKLADYQLVKCGSVYVAAGDPAGDWNGLKNLDEAGLEDRMGQGTWGRVLSKVAGKGRGVYGALALLGVAAGLGIAYAAFMPDSVSSQGYYAEATRWLKNIAPAGSELKLTKAKDGKLVLSGYVATSYQNELLGMAVNDSVYRPALEVFAVEQMVASMSRLANLENLPCIAVYAGAGRLSCNNDIHDNNQAIRLQALAQQVPGVKVLNLRPITPMTTSDHLAVAPAALPGAVEEEPKVPIPEGPVRDFDRKIHVVMTKAEKYIVDSRGLKFHEGDTVDGYLVKSIQLDQVQLERNGRNFLIMVAIARG